MKDNNEKISEIANDIRVAVEAGKRERRASRLAYKARSHEISQEAKRRALEDFKLLPARAQEAARKGEEVLFLGIDSVLAAMCKEAGLPVKSEYDDGPGGSGYTLFYLVI